MHARRDPDEFANPPRRFRTPLLLTAGLAAAGLVATLLVWLPGRLDCGGPGSGLVREDGECVGVTDGSHPFLPRNAEDLERDYRAVQELIRKENDRVAGNAKKSENEKIDAVKIALLLTLTPDHRSPLSPERILHSMEGAHTAQKRANEGRIGDEVPQIQLLLANAGSRHTRWSTPVEALKRMTDDPIPLVAVVGPGISTEDTREAARELAEEGIPVIASTASADNLFYDEETAEGPVLPLARVTGSNTEFVKALHRYTTDRDDLRTAVLVHDRNATDLHVTSLTAAFSTVFEAELGKNPAQPFQGTTIGDRAVPALFDSVTRNVCGTEADMVLFSGRLHDLTTFITKLGERTCRARSPLSVLFVDTGPMSQSEEMTDLLGIGDLTLVQAAAVDPRGPTGEETGGETPEGFAGFLEGHTKALAPEKQDAALDTIRDGYAVIHHDAVMTAVRAARMAYAEAPTEELQAEGVANALFLLNSGNTVSGAGGTLSFTEELRGEPGGRPLPVIETPSGPGHPATYLTPMN
ncbi:hypothetical protein [Streptomyces alkaliphilus]|uniref:hypothetical protein n=1 Tax=Streptomyces alkaliphilus TaxID=1472722 RepID=UPI00117C4FAE|nr:hypothetical protein [Streptomyces alkaliphilus]MQS08602.1 hypothetical protein [Streptomyces alkaliphilus]